MPNYTENTVSTIRKNILLVLLPYLLDSTSLNSKLRSFKAFPYGLLSLATYLKRQIGNSLNIEILDCNFNDGRDIISVIKGKLTEFKPDVVGLSMMFDNSYGYLKDISITIKKYNKDTIVVLGGAAATASYASIMAEQENIDGICFSEGEIPFLRMLNSKNMLDFVDKDVSWITRSSLREGRVPKKTLVENLDDVIAVDYGFIDTSSYAMGEAFSPFAGQMASRKQFFLLTSRGCPFKCTFCMRSADDDKDMRYASVKEIINHLRFLVSEYNMNVLTIYDDQILLDKERAKHLFRELAQFNFRIECPNGLSVAFMDDELIKLMRDAGMDTVFLAIESGSPYVLNELIHKPLKLKMVKPVVKTLRKHNFWIHGFFVSGMPGERDEHRDETVEFIKEVGLDWSGFSLATPSRGSELFKICIENGYIRRDMGVAELDVNKYIINTPEYTPEYVAKKTYTMNLDVNFVNNYRMKHGEYRIAADAFMDVIKRYPNHAFAYYYLSKSLYALNKDREAQLAMENFYEIKRKDDMWKEYVKYFNIS
uniref:Radical SAM superfamily enzyme YgiQ, UPF0313 family n=1 Tax=Candidatus Kentrum sp. LFY TaxID=2126342 RepID=A0A450UU63_9GAMM|nr:MAG: Radical SAM superfamily enzyme YgiQ, UPF0313 family [Candidatus Kentron sp. LFY]